MKRRGKTDTMRHIEDMRIAVAEGLSLDVARKQRAVKLHNAAMLKLNRKRHS